MEELPDVPVVELDDSEDLPVRIGVDLPEEEIVPDEEDAPDPDAPPLPTRYAVAKSTVHEDFEDGQYVGIRTSMRVPPRVIEEGGRTFLRITGNRADTTAIPRERYPNRSRSTIIFTSSYSQMPLMSDANMRQTYTADLRVRFDQGAPYCSIFEMFQGAPGGESGGYGSPNGTGPSARFITRNGHTCFESRYQNEQKIDVYDLGVSHRDWHTYQLDAVWSHDPRQGRFEVFVDGKLTCTVRGRDVCMGPATNRLPAVKFGLYGDAVTGTCDLDNVHLYPTGGYVPGTPPPTQPTPEPPLERRTGAVNAGGTAYTATDGTVYAADRRYVGGRKETVANPIAGTTDVPLYQSWHYGNFHYTAPCANGNYLVTLHFAEHLHTEAGKRVFDVSIEGEPVITRLDVFAKVGAKTAYDVQIPVTVTDRALTVGFEKLVGNAMVSAIKVEPR